MRDLRDWRFWLATAIIALWCCEKAWGQPSIVPPPHKVTAGSPALFRIDRLAADDLPRITIAVSPATCRAALVPSPFGGHYVWFEASENGLHVLAVAIGTDTKPILVVIAVDVGGDNPTPPPPLPPLPPPDDGITAVIVQGWIATVPMGVRTEVIDDPVTGESYTRQEAVGKTFSEIGGVVKSLGSIEAANVMLTTGLAAAFGPNASDWKTFAELVDKALARAEQKRITPTEYGKILSIIGGALL